MENKEKYIHEIFMRKCIELALVAKQRGESAVGSVLVRNGEIVGEGIESAKEHKDITFHAEIEAVRQATKFIETADLSDCIMYTTHEPCIMCSYVIRHWRIKTIVIGVTTGEIGGFSSQLPLLLDETIKRWGQVPEIITGVLEQECSEL